MGRFFNITGSCYPDKHYMVDLTSRLEQIKKLIDNGDYFTINRGRQHGKTTMLSALERYLQNDYITIDMDFQFMDSSDYETTQNFVKGFARELWNISELRADMSTDIQEQIKELKKIGGNFALGDLFSVLSEWNREAEKPIVLMIDEVDSASNNQVFLDFLAQLRGYYLKRDKRPTFQSVILAGVHDIRNIKRKIRPDETYKHNSPWNISAEFNIDMSFNADDIFGMLKDYENDRHTDMHIIQISQLIYDYTSGYPVLVSSMCKYMDEEFGWSKEGALNAVSKILSQPTPLFESLIDKIETSVELKSLIYGILIYGKKYSYNPDDDSLKLAMMYGLVRKKDNLITVANRIFETRIYDWFISVEKTSKTYSAGENDKSQFILDSGLDMEHILEKFIIHFNEIYGDKPESFREEEGRKLFMLYLRPIINGTGNYYIEAQTRDQKRTDIIVDYLGKQYIIELKIWRGNEYNSRGEQQLSDYLDYYNAVEGYMLSFNFNKNKHTGIKKIEINGKTIIEAVV